jgi:hypothetical protein
MTSSSASAISETLDHAFRAALLLTGGDDLAEDAVRCGIAALQCGDDIEKTLVVKTIESAIRQRAKSSNGLDRALARLPEELHWVMLLDPVPRDCFMLRTLFGVRPEHCTAILNLTTEEFEVGLNAAWQQIEAQKGVVCQAN